jgi:hypothetical protein
MFARAHAAGVRPLAGGAHLNVTAQAPLGMRDTGIVIWLAAYADGTCLRHFDVASVIWEGGQPRANGHRSCGPK